MRILLFITALFFARTTFAQGTITPLNLWTETSATALKIIDSNAILYIENKNIIKYLKKAGKENGTDYKLMLKKLKGVCFSTINLNKEITDKEISDLQGLLKSEILTRALLEGKVAITPLGSERKMSTAFYVLANNNTQEGTIIYTYQYLDANGRIMFTGNQSKKKK
jgi:hypothetical protein